MSTKLLSYNRTLCSEYRWYIIIIIIIERKDYGGVLSKTARTPNSFCNMSAHST